MAAQGAAILIMHLITLSQLHSVTRPRTLGKEKSVIAKLIAKAPPSMVPHE